MLVWLLSSRVFLKISERRRRSVVLGVEGSSMMLSMSSSSTGGKLDRQEIHWLAASGLGEPVLSGGVDGGVRTSKGTL